MQTLQSLSAKYWMFVVRKKNINSNNKNDKYKKLCGDANVTEKMKKCGNANETVPQQAANRAGQ